MTRIRIASLFALALALAGAPARAASPIPVRVAPAHADTATFALGCFWCGETDFEGQPGVLSVISGYTGGHVDHPTYEQVGTGETGHFESVQVLFDPAKTTYAKLVDLFWHSVDPTQDDGQFCDRGNEYRSAIFFHGDAQRREAFRSKARIEASGVLHAPIVTLIRPASTFWPAEDYHQDFWKKNPTRYHEYRQGCGRDQRLAQLWGKLAGKPLVH